MAELKTKPTNRSVPGSIDGLDVERKKTDNRRLLVLMKGMRKGCLYLKSLQSVNEDVLVGIDQTVGCARRSRRIGGGRNTPHRRHASARLLTR